MVGPLWETVRGFYSYYRPVTVTCCDVGVAPVYAASE